MPSKTTNKTSPSDPTEPARQALNQARDALTEATTTRENAEARLADLIAQADAGQPVSGLSAVRDEAEVSQRIEAARARALADTEADYARAVADETARQVEEKLSRDGSPTMVQDAERAALTALVESLSVIPDAIAERDRVCDDAGQRLHEAGVPTGTTVGRIAYGPVSSGMTRTIPGQWNIRLDGDRYSNRVDLGYSKREATRLTEEALTVALGKLGMKMTGHLQTV